MTSSTYQLVELILAEAEAQADRDRAAGVYTLIGALVRHPNGGFFSQRRSKTRSFGPGLWDNVGGHVEGQETLEQTLRREMIEETGWHLDHVMGVVAIRDWHDPRGPSREYIVVCRARGDLDHPTLEPNKVDRTAWITADNIGVMNENRPDDRSQLDIYQHALTLFP
jgi:8-oxo-dGTP diphosphatase